MPIKSDFPSRLNVSLADHKAWAFGSPFGGLVLAILVATSFYVHLFTVSGSYGFGVLLALEIVGVATISVLIRAQVPSVG